MILLFSKKIKKGPLKGWITDFEAKIEDGRKKHTIRKDAHNRWEAENIIHFSTGFNKDDQFLKGICTGIQWITIERWSIPDRLPLEKQYYCEKRNKYYSIDVSEGMPLNYLTEKEMEELAVNDGFDNLEQFFDWFDEYIEVNGWRGKLIHWSDIRY